MNEIHLKVSLPTDDEGMFGRECPNCKQYFKVKAGTGLADISTCTCPYCEHTDDSGNFLTTAQQEYLESIAIREVLGPALQNLESTFKNLERSTRHSLISFKVQTHGLDLPIKYYSEAELETIVTCDHCGLVFAIYGIFASCPDCARLTAMSMFRNSLEAARKRLGILERIPAEEMELRDALLVDTLSAAVATFDSLGKRLQKQFPAIIPDKPRNLFQNLDALGEALEENTSVDLPALIGPEQFLKVYYLFQVRHIWNHNFGQADTDFVRKTKRDASMIGTKVSLSEQDVKEFLDLIESLGVNLHEKLQEHAQHRLQLTAFGMGMHRAIC